MVKVNDCGSAVYRRGKIEPPGPGKGNLAQRHIPEAFGPLCDRFAAEMKVETACCIVVGKRPDQQPLEPQLGEADARAVEQLLAKTEALVGGMHIKLENLALERRAAHARAAP